MSTAPANHTAAAALRLVPDAPPRDTFLTFGKPQIGAAEAAEVQAVLDSGWLGTGPRVAQFETDFARYVDAPHAVGVNSCTAALHLALIAAGIGQNALTSSDTNAPADEVITTPLTFCATANAVLHAGGRPVLADIDPQTGNLDPDAVERAITPRTRAVLAVHYAGRPCDLDRLQDICERRDLTLIEDCAHAIEARHRGRAAGTFGRFGCFSFYATKNLTTGEGGMLVTADPDAAQRVRTLSLHGLSRDAWDRFGPGGYRPYRAVEVGFKYNMMDLQAALGIHQLAALEAHLVRREAIWNRYQQAFADLPLDLPAEPAAHTRHARHLYVVRLQPRQGGLTRDAFLDAMTRRKIGVGVHYDALPEHPVYRTQLGWAPDDVPHATRWGRRAASLPLTPYLTDNDVDDVIDAVRAAFARPRAVVVVPHPPEHVA